MLIIKVVFQLFSFSSNRAAVSLIEGGEGVLHPGVRLPSALSVCYRLLGTGGSKMEEG